MAGRKMKFKSKPKKRAKQTKARKSAVKIRRARKAAENAPVRRSLRLRREADEKRRHFEIGPIK